MTAHPDLFAALARPFAPEEVKTRTQSGRTLHYITARTAMNRLDEVLGPENWWDRYRPGENSVLCELTIRLPDGTELTKCDAGGYAGMADSGDDDKSGYSDAFKRAAVKFGVSRYLYRDGVPSFVRERVQGGEDLHAEPAPAQRQGGQEPGRGMGQAQRPESRQGGDHRGDHRPQGNGGGQGYDGPPRSGKALFAWTRSMEDRYSVGLLKYLNGWAKMQEFPGRMVDWNASEVELAYAEACRKLQTLRPGDDEDPRDESHGN